MKTLLFASLFFSSFSASASSGAAEFLRCQFRVVNDLFIAEGTLHAAFDEGTQKLTYTLNDAPEIHDGVGLSSFTRQDLQQNAYLDAAARVLRLKPAEVNDGSLFELGKVDGIGATHPLVDLIVFRGDGGKDLGAVASVHKGAMGRCR